MTDHTHIREWRDSDHSSTNDSAIIGALRGQVAKLEGENAKMLRHIENIQTEKRQLRAALTAAQLALEALERATGVQS